MISIVVDRRWSHQVDVGAALLAGFSRHGVKAAVVSMNDPVGDVVCCWGWRRALCYPGKNVLVAECGYVGDRLHWKSLGWNGLNGRATFPDGDGSRWPFPKLKPWKRGGDYILLVGQVPGDASLMGVDIVDWANEAADALKVHGLPVRFRPHPKAAGVKIPGVESIGGSLADCLNGAKWTVTFNSNTGVDAVFNGVPVVTCDIGAMAWDVAGHWLADQPPMPEREAWARRLAYCQWTDDEIASGEAWDNLKRVGMTQ